MHPSTASKPTITPRSTVAIAVVLTAIRAYKLLISPYFAGCCRYQPSCADYMAEAVASRGAVRGVAIGLRRLARCHPFGGHGLDPVPRS